MIEEPPENDMEHMKYEDSPYHFNYYKDLPSLQNDAYTTLTHTQSPDGMNQTIYASIYQPSDVLQSKMFACGADVHPGYVDFALGYVWMKYEHTYEESPWNYPCYPNC